MKLILRIAKLELNTLFYSPIAWLLAIVFIFQSSLTYTNEIQFPLISQNIGGESLSNLLHLTANIFAPPTGMFLSVISKIYLYLPLLTMGLISREISSGTIKLLYSSPIKVNQIVLGKFFAMIAYNLLLTGILGIYVIAGIFNIQHADIGLLLSGLLGIFLLLCVYAAIGLFMSSLTSYQIVAALSTLVIFAILDYIGQIWQDVDVVRDLTYFLSISGRTNHMLSGLISTSDLLYFIIVTGMFLLFCIIKMQSGRSTASWIALAGRYVGVFALTLLIGYISAIPGFIGYFDATVNKTQTLTPNTQKVLKNIGNSPLEVTSYINLLDQDYWFGKPDQRKADLNRWEPYLRFKHDIKFNYIYYYAAPLDPNIDFRKLYPGKTLKQIALQNAESWNSNLDNYNSPEQLSKIIDLRPEQNRYVMQLQYKGKKTFLRLYNDTRVFPSETEITAALKRLLLGAPKVAFLQGEYERSIEKAGPHDYGAITNDITFRNALINQGFDTETISLKKQDIPKDIAALVIGDPRAPFAPEVLTKIQQYIATGGNLFIAGEPDKKEVLDSILQPLGVQIIDGTLLQTSRDYPLNMVATFLTKSASELSGDLKKMFRDSVGVNMPGVSGLRYQINGLFRITPLLMTDSKTTWNKKGQVVLDSATIGYSSVNGDDHSSMPVMLALTRKINGKEQRIIVAGDADFLTTGAFNRSDAGNFQFSTQLFRWFTYGEFPIDTSRPESKDNRVNLSNSSLAALKILFLGLLPGLLLIFSGIFLVRRKRK